jgi:predicted nucleic acid-binding Zn finger protein
MATATLASPSVISFAAPLPTENVTPSGLGTMTVRTANNKTAGVKTVYVTGDSGKEYIVQFVRRAGMRRELCSCPDFTFRGSLKRSHRSCKHIRAARAHRKAEREAARHNAAIRERLNRCNAELKADAPEHDEWSHIR